MRALDSIRFFWPPLREARADLADLVWLQLIKDGNPSLFRWVEEYCATAAVLSLGTAMVEEAERMKTLAVLMKSDELGHFEDLTYRYYFAEQLPGVEVDYSKDGGQFKLYQRVTEEVRDAAIKGRRLASPDHYRLYFALAGPLHALGQLDLDAVWSATEAGADETEVLLLQWHTEGRAGPLGKVDMLFERLRGGTHELLTPTQCMNLSCAISNTMDKAYRIRGFDFSWINSLWDRAEKLLPVLLSSLNASERQSALESMFKDGDAISWLTTLFRSETFAHGRFGSRRRPQEDWLLADPELDQVTQIMTSRYSSMSAAEVLAVIDPIGLLFAWQQSGEEVGPRRLIESYIGTDEGLVETLESLASSITSSRRGTYQVLKRQNLAPFLDYDCARDRIRDLQTSEPLASRAQALARFFVDGEEI